MKMFLYGAIFGVICTSVSWWALQWPHYKDCPREPFNDQGTYRISSAKGYLVIKKDSSGTQFTLYRDAKSSRDSDSSSVIIPPDWFKTEDWFAYVDKASRIWIYNGINELMILAERDGIIYSYQAREFAPEDALLVKIPYYLVRQTWNDDTRRRWQRLDLCEQSASSNH